MKTTLRPIVFVINIICIVLLAANLDLETVFKLSTKELFLFVFYPVIILVGHLLMFMYYRTGAFTSIAGLILYYLIYYLLNHHFPQGSFYFLFLAAPILAIVDRFLIPKKF
ncbi:MAG: hypothetical protein ACK4K9_08805 [Bacteroidia bacterium]